MQLVFTSQSAQTPGVRRPVSEGARDVSFELAPRARTQADAVMMAGLYAVERYVAEYADMQPASCAG